MQTTNAIPMFITFGPLFSPTETQRCGLQKEDVRNIQPLLNANKASLNIDGAFGAKTQHAVINFQKQQQIVAEGIVCPKTWNKFGFCTIIF